MPKGSSPETLKVHALSSSARKLTSWKHSLGRLSRAGQLAQKPTHGEVGVAAIELTHVQRTFSGCSMGLRGDARTCGSHLAHSFKSSHRASGLLPAGATSARALGFEAACSRGRRGWGYTPKRTLHYCVTSALAGDRRGTEEAMKRRFARLRAGL